MKFNIKEPIKKMRFNSLPADMLVQLKKARINQGLSQAELGKRIGLPQMHISGIETGKIVPRFDTLLEIVRILNFDLVLVPRSLVPLAYALIRDPVDQGEDRSLYANDE